jgi:hypothetical protein
MPRTNAQEDPHVKSALNKLQEHPTLTIPEEMKLDYPPPPPGMCVLNKTHVDLSPMANHVHSTSTEGFLYPRTNYPHKKQ